MLRILSTQTQQWQGLLLTLYEHEFRGQELNVVFSCLSIDYLSSDVVTRKLGLERGEDLKPIPTEMRGAVNEPEIDRLSNILQTFNDRYGTVFEDADKVRQMAENIASDVAKNNELISSIQHSDEQNARITSDKIVGEELLKHITTNFDLYKLYSDNKDFKEDFSAMMFGVVKELISKGINA